MTSRPDIVFREGAAGRRAALAGHRLDVWQVVETVRLEDGDIGAVATYLSISTDLVAAAVGYYADHPAEIEAWIARNSAMAEEAEAAWRRRQAARR
jgi:uncharacterized protein (DUF433 family)